MSGLETTRYDNLIHDMCFINGVSLFDMIDTGVTHSFISLDYARKLNLEVSFVFGSTIIDTSYNGLMTTLWVYLNFPLTIYGKEFGIDLVFL